MLHVDGKTNNEGPGVGSSQSLFNSSDLFVGGTPEGGFFHGTLEFLRISLGTLKDGFFNGLEVCTVLCLLLLAIGPIAQMATTTNLAGKLSSTLSGIVPHNLIFILDPDDF